MIELTQIPVSSKLKELRGQINTMVNEINTDQMVIGQLLNPSASIYSNNTLIGAVPASQWLTNQLFAVCLPESNGVYVAQVFGSLIANANVSTNSPITDVSISIPAIKLPNREAAVSTFVTPDHLGFTPEFVNTTRNTGLQFAVFATSTAGDTAAVTDLTIYTNPATTMLNVQQLHPRTSGSLLLELKHQQYRA